MAPKAVWRLIPLLAAPGTVQMAIDRWLLERHRQGKHPPTLRFYTWEPIAISLGYHQKRWPDFWHDLTWQGKSIDLVRRPTGGRAVLHQGDLTYGAIASGMGKNRLQAYRNICQFLIAGWKSLGIDLDYGSSARGYIHHPSCFATATGADLIDSRGQKLIGSSQLRQGDAILQHGSMIISPSAELFTLVFGEPAPPKIELPGNPEKPDAIRMVVAALTKAAANCFDLEFSTQPLSEREWQEVLSSTK